MIELVVARYVWAGLLVIAGIYLNVYSKNRASWDAIAVRLWHRARQILGLEPQYHLYNLSLSVV